MVEKKKKKSTVSASPCGVNMLRGNVSSNLNSTEDDGYLLKSFEIHNNDGITFYDYDNYEYYAIDMVKKEMRELKAMKKLARTNEMLMQEANLAGLTTSTASLSPIVYESIADHSLEVCLSSEAKPFLASHLMKDCNDDSCIRYDDGNFDATSTNGFSNPTYLSLEFCNDESLVGQALETSASMIRYDEHSYTH